MAPALVTGPAPSSAGGNVPAGMNSTALVFQVVAGTGNRKQPQP